MTAVIRIEQIGNHYLLAIKPEVCTSNTKEVIFRISKETANFIKNMNWKTE